MSLVSWKIRRLAAALALSSTVGCVTATKPVRLRTASPDAFWVAGRETVAYDEDGVRIAAAFERGVEGTLSIRVEVLNETDERIDVNPAAFWFNHCEGLHTSDCGPSAPVVNPEVRLDELDTRVAHERADATNQAGLAAGLMLLSAVAVAGEVSSGSRRSHSDRHAVMSYHAASSASDRSEANADRLESTRETIAAQALRRTTLFPGKGVAGLVYVPVNYERPYVRLNVKAGERVVVFAWRQEYLYGRPTQPIDKIPAKPLPRQTLR